MITFIWIAISVGAVVLELITPTALVSIWFAVGGIIAVILAALNMPFMASDCSIRHCIFCQHAGGKTSRFPLSSWKYRCDKR